MELSKEQYADIIALLQRLNFSNEEIRLALKYPEITETLLTSINEKKEYEKRKAESGINYLPGAEPIPEWIIENAFTRYKEEVLKSADIFRNTDPEKLKDVMRQWQPGGMFLFSDVMNMFCAFNRACNWPTQETTTERGDA